LFAKPTQTRRGVINKEILKQALIQFGSSVASEKEINKLIDSLPTSENGAYSDFDYLKHINMFMG
jgi:Ca2+-binding EF-hand superfamily protein